MSDSLESLRYPIGRFVNKSSNSQEDIKSSLVQLKEFPIQLMNVVKNLDETQLEQTYRPNSWTARQIIHHLADSHLNAYIRIKRTITEESPNVYGYLEQKWAELSDSKNLQVQPSLMIIQGVHSRWTSLLEKLDQNTLAKSYYHMEYEEYYSISDSIALYAWHGLHHLEHIKMAAR